MADKIFGVDFTDDSSPLGSWTLSVHNGTALRDVSLSNFHKGLTVPFKAVGQTTAPTANDDSDDGYKAGDLWLDETNKIVYIAASVAAGNAVWMAVGLRLSSISPKVYTANDTWTKPARLAFVLIEAVGGGGGGGGVTGVAAQSAVGGGGGGGEYGFKRVEAASLGSTETVTVGAGGAGGTAGANDGSTGGTTSFGTHVTAIGGSGGQGQAASATVPRLGGLPGAGGTGGTGGSFYEAGEPGGIAITVSTASVMPSRGGASKTARSVVSINGGTADEAGTPGLAYGGGGGGARSSNDATNRAGGAGAAGLVRIWEYVY
jgi:hypothetical protein